MICRLHGTAAAGLIDRRENWPRCGGDAVSKLSSSVSLVPMAEGRSVVTLCRRGTRAIRARSTPAAPSTGEMRRVH